MDRAEFSKMAMVIRTSYPQSQVLTTREAMDVWYEMLGDIPNEAATMAVKKWVASEKWPPTIADIREAAAKAVTPEIPEWSDAWEKVIQAIGRWGMHRESEALATMNETAQQTVKRMGWQHICLSENIGVERATFRDIYIVIAKRKERDAQLPESLRIAVTDKPLIGGNA